MSSFVPPASWDGEYLSLDYRLGPALLITGMSAGPAGNRHRVCNPEGMNDSSGFGLRGVLDSRLADDLRSRARLVATSPPTRKTEIADLLYQVLTDPSCLRSRWDSLDDLEKQAVREAVHAGGVLSREVFEAKHGRLPDIGGVYRSYGRHGGAEPLDLFFFDDRIPEEPLQILKQFVPPPEEFVLSGRDEAPEAFTPADGEPVPLHRADTERAALHDLLAVLELARDGKLAVGEKTGAPGAAALRALAPRLLLPGYFPDDRDDTIRAFGLIVGAQAGGLVKAAGGRLQLTRNGTAFLREPTVERLRAAWERWLNADSPDELRRITSLKGQQSRRTHLTPPSERKGQIAETLARCPAGQWVAIEEFFRAMRAWDLVFDVERSDYTGLYVGYSAEYGWLGGSSIDTFLLVQAQYTLVVLWEYAAAFGAVDLLYTAAEDADYLPQEFDFDELYFSRYDGLKYFRINSLGAYLLGLAEEYAGPAQTREAAVFTVLPNLDVAVTRPAQFPPNDRALLERAAAAAGEGVFRLDREKILTAVEEGLAVDVLAEFLASRSAKEIPETVQRFLADIAANARSLEKPARALLIRCRDPHLCDLIAHDSAAGKLCRPAGPEHLVVREEDEAAFRRRLKKMGYVLPR